MENYDFENALSLPFSQLTEEVKNSYISQWTREIITWMNRARSYIKHSSGLEEKLSNYNINNYNDYSKMLKNRRMAKEMILNKTVLRDGYILLNKIGEIIRGEEILYSVTVTSTGEAISSATAGEVYTWTIPMSEFINLMSFTSRRIVLKDSMTIYRMIEHQIEQSANAINYERWSDEKLQHYSLFMQQIRSYPQWENVNNGNILEAFLRFLDRGHKPLNSTMPEYRETVYSAMLDTMKHPAKFFEGGDINNLQVKGLNASITNINTLMKNLSEVLHILATHDVGNTVLRQHMKKQALNTQLNQKMNTIVADVTEELIQFFTSTIDR